MQPFTCIHDLRIFLALLEEPGISSKKDMEKLEKPEPVRKCEMTISFCSRFIGIVVISKNHWRMKNQRTWDS